MPRRLALAVTAVPIVAALVVAAVAVTAAAFMETSRPAKASPVKTLPTPTWTNTPTITITPGGPTLTPTIPPTPTSTPSTDTDGDGVIDVLDNCYLDDNPGQENADANFIDQTPPKPFDDLTWPVSDGEGDVCDSDDDNDLYFDSWELYSVTHLDCPAYEGPLDPLNRDTDGDRVLDRIECALGANPTDPTSVPPSILAPDADRDGAPDDWDTNDADIDTDDDGVRDGVELRYYNSTLWLTNTDGDSCGDAREIASVDPNLTVNAADLGLVASAFGAYPIPITDANRWRWNMDMDKNGTVNAADLGFVASKFGACPQGPAVARPSAARSNHHASSIARRPSAPWRRDRGDDPHARRPGRPRRLPGLRGALSLRRDANRRLRPRRARL